MTANANLDEGVSLLAMVEAGRDRKRLDELGIARVIADLAETLDDPATPPGATGRSIVPSNVLVSRAGKVALDSKPTPADDKVGYTAPERLRGEPGDDRSDVFSLGVVMWEALAHARLFEGFTDDATRQAVLDGDIEPPSSRNANIPSVIDVIVLRALSRDASARYATPKAMAVEIESMLRDAEYGRGNDAIAKFAKGLPKEMFRRPAGGTIPPPMKANAAPAAAAPVAAAAAAAAPAPAAAKPKFVAKESTGTMLGFPQPKPPSSTGIPVIEDDGRATAPGVGIPAIPPADVEAMEADTKPSRIGLESMPVAVPVAIEPSKAVVASKAAVEASKSVGTVVPVEASKPVGAAAPVGAWKSAVDASKPVEASKVAMTVEASKAAVEAASPVGTWKSPVEASKPVGAVVPVEASKPVGASKSTVEASKAAVEAAGPVGAWKSAVDASKPVGAAPVDVSKAAVDASRPVDAFRPVEASRSVETSRPVEASKPSSIMKGTATVMGVPKLDDSVAPRPKSVSSRGMDTMMGVPRLADMVANTPIEPAIDGPAVVSLGKPEQTSGPIAINKGESQPIELKNKSKAKADAIELPAGASLVPNPPKLPSGPNLVSKHISSAETQATPQLQAKPVNARARAESVNDFDDDESSPVASTATARDNVRDNARDDARDDGLGGWADREPIDDDEVAALPQSKRGLIIAIAGAAVVLGIVMIIAMASGGSPKDADQAAAPKPPNVAMVQEPAATLVAPDAAASEATKVEPSGSAEPANVEPSGSAGPAKVEPTAAGEPSKVPPTAAGEPSKVEPSGSAEPTNVEPSGSATRAAAEPTKVEPGSTKTEPAKTEPARTEPTKTEPAKTEPAKTEHSRIEPTMIEPKKKTEPKVAKADKTDKLDKTDKAEPKKTDKTDKTDKAEPKKTDKLDKTDKAEPKHTTRPRKSDAPIDPYPDSKPDAEASYRNGVQAFARGDSQAALASLRTAQDANPRYAPTYRGLGLVYEKLGDRDKAVRNYRQYLKLAPSAGDAEQIRTRLERLGS